MGGAGGGVVSDWIGSIDIFVYFSVYLLVALFLCINNSNRLLHYNTEFLFVKGQF